MRLLLNTSLFPDTFFCTNWNVFSMIRHNYRSICKRIVELHMTTILINFNKSVPIQNFHNFSYFFCHYIFLNSLYAKLRKCSIFCAHISITQNNSKSVFQKWIYSIIFIEYSQISLIFYRLARNRKANKSTFSRRYFPIHLNI